VRIDGELMEIWLNEVCDRMIEQGGRTCNEYVQEFKKVTRGNGYEGRPLIEEFKRGLSGAIRKKLAEAEEPLSTIGE